ncbi:mavicyanin-like [Solanum pennellii]|uniref:Mavicyanin-like n=1 Tax=Solanum pennellii TaxID=28526 RepID=A0ABM1UYQ9_SOLPN|nr:mavicyanin-like [Solanum pennellii]
MAKLRSTTAVVYEVGDSWGWTFNYNYEQWAASKHFQFGDVLIFNYDPKLHNVMQVNINDYNSCTASNPIATFNSGSDSISLDTPDGDYFFISGIPGDCASGLKLHIKVSQTATTTPPPPTTMNTPATPPPPPTLNDHYPYIFPASSRNHSSASNTAYSFNMLFALFLLPMV